MSLTTKEILKKVRRIEIKTKGLTQQIFSGAYHSKFKGRGMTFSEVREYNIGDEIRTIDWNVTARFNQPYVKIFEEERELTFMLLIDCSYSENFGTHRQTKRDLITELAAVLAFSASQNNDKVGAIFFSDEIEKFVPPQKGKQQILRIIRELINFRAKSKKTNIAMALKYMHNMLKKKAVTFLISDCIDTQYESELKIIAKKHDIVALQISDRHEDYLPNIGLIKVYDPEKNQYCWINSSNKKVRNKFEMARKEFFTNTQTIFSKARVDHMSFYTGDSFVKNLVILFQKRGLRK